MLLIAKFRLKLNKVGKLTRTFRYELNQIPYDYTVEVTNRFRGLDLVDRVPEEQWMEVHNFVQDVWKWKSLSHVPLFETSWTSLGQSTGVGSLSLLQGIFPTQGLNPHWGSDQNHCKEKEMQEVKVVIWGGFTKGWRKKRKAREKGKDMRVSIPRQVDEKSGGPRGDRGLEFSRRRKGQTSFFPLYIP